MADDQFQQREAAYNNNVGLVMGRFAKAMVEVQNEADDAYIRRFEEVVKLPNIKANGSISVIGEEKPLGLAMDVPAVLVANTEPFGLTSAEMNMTLDISASNTMSTGVDSKTHVGGSGSANFLFYKMSVNMSADVTVRSDRKRTSDYRSHMDANLKMGVRATPEGVLMFKDIYTDFFKSGSEINKMAMQASLAEKQAALQGKIDENKTPEPDPPADDGNGDAQPAAA